MKTRLACFLLLLTSATCSFSQTSLFDSLLTARRAEVFFPFGKSELTAAADTAIEAFSSFCKKEPGLHQIRLTAHADSIGGAAANLSLSQKRAEAVRDHLVSDGLDGSKITFRFFGECRPAAQNSTEEGRQANRRATLEALFLKKMATVAGRVADEKTGRGIAATVFFKTRTTADSVSTDTSGRFSVRLPEGQAVGVEAFAKGHFFESQTVKVGPRLPMLLLKLPSAEPGAVLPIKNLYFVGDEATLLPTSVPALNGLLKFMRQSPGLRIELAGHVNMPLQIQQAANGGRLIQPEKWSDDRLMALSVARAKTVRDFLEKNGIPAVQLTHKGYSNAQMAFPHARTDAEQAANRRVEVRVLKVD